MEKEELALKIKQHTTVDEFKNTAKEVDYDLSNEEVKNYFERFVN